MYHLTLTELFRRDSCLVQYSQPFLRSLQEQKKYKCNLVLEQKNNAEEACFASPTSIYALFYAIFAQNARKKALLHWYTKELFFVVRDQGLEPWTP